MRVYWLQKMCLFLLQEPDLFDPSVGEKVIVDMVDLLPESVIDNDLEMVGDAELFSNQFGGLIQKSQYLRRRAVEIRIKCLGNDKKVNRGFGVDIRNDDDFVGFVKNAGGQFSLNNPAEY